MGYEATEDCRLRTDVPNGPNVDLLVRRLIDRGLVFRTGRATYAFAPPLFRGYIRRRRKLTELTGSVRTSWQQPHAVGSWYRIPDSG
jgi:hypothetical protein